MEKKQKQPDPLVTLKYRGYCLALTPPGENYTIDDFVNYAKFFLCKQTHTLFLDSIWEKYSDEEIMREYFAYYFINNKEARTEFEAKHFSGTETYGEDIYDWLDRMIAENRRDMDKKREELPEKISFSPATNTDKEE